MFFRVFSSLVDRNGEIMMVAMVVSFIRIKKCIACMNINQRLTATTSIRFRDKPTEKNKNNLTRYRPERSAEELKESMVVEMRKCGFFKQCYMDSSSLSFSTD